MADKLIGDWNDGANPSDINLRSKGRTNFVIFGSADAHASVEEIDLSTLFADDDNLFDNKGATAVLKSQYGDFNNDGITDVKLFFGTSRQNESLADFVAPGATQLNVFGQYNDGTNFIACQQEGDPLNIFA